MSERILITGAGVVSAIGLDKQQTLESLLARRTGVDTVKYLETNRTEFPVGEVKLSNAEMRQVLGIPYEALTTRTSMMGIMALKEAIAQAGLSAEDLVSAALIGGTTVGGMDSSERHYLDFINPDTKENAEYISVHDCGATTDLIADYFGGFSLTTTLSTACSSAANAIILGANLIKTGQADIVAVGGSECLSSFHVNGFNTLMILDREQCRPFDATRAGLNLGEGAGFLILESEASVERRKAPPLAVLAGYGNACDAFHQTASSPDGEGAYLAMSKALEMAGVQPADVDYINAHGTGTPNNDASESAAMGRVFGGAVPFVSSTKSFTGHTTSASGSIESVICLLAMEHSFVPVSLGWKEPSEGCIVPFNGKSEGHELKNVLCNSFGFGGNDSSLLFSKI